LDAEGYLFLTGRLKEIINRSGEKISPYEVETALREHPAIADAAAFPLPHAALGEDVAAAVTLKPQFSPTEHEIQLFAASRLTECKVPRRVVILNEIPKGPTGKIERLHLALQLGLGTIDGPATDPKPDFVAPRTELEATLARIWSQVLRVAQVGIHDDFFQLGGESIVTAQIINRVRTELQVELSPVRFFETPTIAGQAVLIEQIALKEAGQSFPATDSVVEGPAGEAFPLSATQRRLWFFQQLNPQSVVAARPVALMLTGEVNRDALEQSLSEIVRRHEILRTIYPEQNGEPVQIVLPFQPIHVESKDLRSLPETKWEPEMKRIALQEARSLSELSKKPPLKPLLFKQGERKYYLLILTHHIAFDGWSEAVLIRELAALYEAFLQGRTSPLPPLPLQYRDFALRQQRRFSETGGEKEIDYWKRRLEGMASTLSLPTISTRSHVPLVERSQRSFMLGSDLSEHLKILSRRESVTPFMILLAVFQILLSRYSQQEDIAVGTLIAGRSQSEIEGLIGSFANLLVLRTDLSAPCTFRELLQKVRKTALEAYEHRELPFDRLIEALEPERRLNQTPLFQVLFELRSMPRVQTITTGDLHIERRSMEFNLGTWELMLQFSQTGDSFHGILEFASELFHPDTIERMAKHYETLLRSIVADPNRQLFNLAMLTQAETEQFMVAGNETRKDYPKDKCIHELFERQVERTPDAIALVFESQQLTYRELNSIANQLAHYLRKQGVGPEVMVGICVTRSVEMVVGILGILKAGGAYVPLDPQYPRERLAFMLGDAQVSVLLTQRRVLEGGIEDRRSKPALREAEGMADGDSRFSIFDPRIQVACLDRDWEDIARESQDNPPRLTTPDNLVYVIYTSGSTGTPKGTLISHHNVVRLFYATHSWFHFNANDVWTLFHSYAFDFSVWELWGALLNGGRLVIVSSEVNRSPEEFYDLLRRERVTVLNQTPGAFRLLMEAEQSIPDCNSLALRLIIFGGESLDVQSLRPWFKRHGDQEPQLVNMYGITETTVHVTYRAIKETDVQSRGSSLIGVPLPDLELHILDQNRQLVPVGVPGELYVGGSGLARGYLNRAELTAERFVIHPFDHREGRRLYKSGDLVRRLSNGELEYLGRFDNQVKIRGFRIELGEIEAVLSQHPEVRQLVVMAREDVPGDKRLVAYVVSDPKKMPTSSELRNFLRERLPDYMLPSSFVFLETLPLTPNGKVDRKALPVPDQMRLGLTEPFASPRTPAEEQLAAIWRELLRRDQVGIRDSFFELGGHSLLLMQLASRITDAFQVRIPLRVLFDRSTIEEMVSAILERRAESADRVKLEQFLAKVAQLSGEEVMQLLKAK
jgi:amino acid adenylation domain-containing protein